MLGWDFLAQSLAPLRPNLVAKELKVLWIPIPKSPHGLLTADKLRPMSISSALRRAWSAARALQMSAEWLPQVINQSTFGGVKHRSVLSMDSSLWDAAWQTQTPLL